jgi:hypothetical protein
VERRRKVGYFGRRLTESGYDTAPELSATWNPCLGRSGLGWPHFGRVRFERFPFFLSNIALPASFTAGEITLQFFARNQNPPAKTCRAHVATRNLKSDEARRNT